MSKLFEHVYRQSLKEGAELYTVKGGKRPTTSWDGDLEDLEFIDNPRNKPGTIHWIYAGREWKITRNKGGHMMGGTTYGDEWIKDVDTPIGWDNRNPDWPEGETTYDFRGRPEGDTDWNGRRIGLIKGAKDEEEAIRCAMGYITTRRGT